MTTLEEAIYAAAFFDEYTRQMTSRMSRTEFGDLEKYRRNRERATVCAHNRAQDLVAAHRQHAPKETKETP